MSPPYAEVIGDPVAHSKSPLIHDFWLAKLGIAAEYRKTRVRPDQLAAYLAARRGDPGWRGCNVTVPHKEAVLPLIETLDPSAGRVGAVNTIVAGAGERLIGHNTDVDGILAALPAALMAPGAEVCLIGAGGAARAALAACKRRGIAKIRISARDRPAAERLRAEFRLEGRVAALDDAHNIRTAEVIINATSLGMIGKPAMPQAILDHLADPLLPGVVVFDMVYAPLDTALLVAARSVGSRTVDGLQMLVAQAAAAFALFFGARAPREHDAELRALLTA